jgi:hypothetical protein
MAEPAEEERVMPREVMDLTLHLHAESAKAILVSDTGNRVDAVWLPLSQVEVETHPAHANTVEVVCPVWLAKDKGLI